MLLASQLDVGRIGAHSAPASHRGRWALLVATLGVVLVVAVMAAAYYRTVVAPANRLVGGIDGEVVMTTNDLVNAVLLRQLLSDDPSNLSGLGRAPFVVADAAMRAELTRDGAKDFGVTVTDEDVESEVHDRFYPPPQTGDQTGTEELDRIYRERYTRFLSARGVSDADYRRTVEVRLLRSAMAEAMPGGVAELEEWLTDQWQAHGVEVDLNSEHYAWVLDEVRAALPRRVTNQPEQQ